MNYRDIFLVVGIVMILLLAMFISHDDEHSVRYDCRLSEVSPDFPPEAREACRRLRAEKTK